LRAGGHELNFAEAPSDWRRHREIKERQGVMANIIRRNEGQQQRDVAQRGRGYDPGYRLDPFRMVGDLLRWDPFSENERWGSGVQGGFLPAVDLRETESAYHFNVDLPGVKEENVDVSLTGNRLTISGTREEETRDQNDRYHAYERSYGSFARSFSLPEGIDADHIQADMKNGVLSVTLPKRPEIQPRRIGIGQNAGAGQQAKPSTPKS
jgi:HSP20 family protein